MTVDDLIVKRISVLCIAALAVAFIGTARAQTDSSELKTAQDATLAPIFKISNIFKDGTLRLQRENQDKFTLRRTGNQAILKFDEDPEVWALRISTGPGNTELFKNDTDRLFLRLSDGGNLSLYTPDYPGEPIAVLEDRILLGNPAPPAENFEEELSTYASLRLGREVTVVLNASDPDVIHWFQDAARVAVKGVIKAASDSETIREIRVLEGKPATLDYSPDGVLLVRINPAKGYFGRASSDRVVLFLKGRFNS